MSDTDRKPGFVNPFRAHSQLMQSIEGKIINDTFFGLASLVCGALATWVFSVGSFFRGCCICLTLIFGLAFYITTIFRVSRNDHSKTGWKAFWVAVVVLIPIIGGLLYYYLRLLIEYLPSRFKDGLRRVMIGGAPRNEPADVLTGSTESGSGLIGSAESESTLTGSTESGNALTGNSGRGSAENAAENSGAESDKSVNFAGLDLNLEGAGPV